MRPHPESASNNPIAVIARPSGRGNLRHPRGRLDFSVLSVYNLCTELGYGREVREMIKRNPTTLLKKALQGTGFVRRGSAFFRVWGDGVLQVLKFSSLRGDNVHELRVGVLSMYGELYPIWFTSFGCIPRGSVSYFVGLHDVDSYLPPDSFTKNDDGQFFFDGFPVCVNAKWRLWDENGERWKYYFTPEQQISILVERVLPWLNTMTSQSLAAKAMYEISPVPNDSLRFDAHLAAGEWEQAEQVISAILAQHADARASWKRTFSQDKYEEMIARKEERDETLIVVHKMVQEKDKEAISRYLDENYRKNCALAKFCMK